MSWKQSYYDIVKQNIKFSNPELTSFNLLSMTKIGFCVSKP